MTARQKLAPGMADDPPPSTADRTGRPESGPPVAADEPSSAQVDDAKLLLQGTDPECDVLDKAAERRLVRRIDLLLIPISEFPQTDCTSSPWLIEFYASAVFCCYALQYYDKALLGRSRLCPNMQGCTTDLPPCSRVRNPSRSPPRPRSQRHGPTPAGLAPRRPSPSIPPTLQLGHLALLLWRPGRHPACSFPLPTSAHRKVPRRHGVRRLPPLPHHLIHHADQAARTCRAIWSAIVLLTTACSSYRGLFANRFFLGLVESVSSPAFLLITGMWYKKDEAVVRIGVWYSATGVCACFASMINYALGHIHGALSPWKYMYARWSTPPRLGTLTFLLFPNRYLVAGSVTMLWAVLIWFFLPDSPTRASRWLSIEQRRQAVQRIRCAHPPHTIPIEDLDPADRF